MSQDFIHENRKGGPAAPPALLIWGKRRSKVFANGDSAVFKKVLSVAFFVCGPVVAVQNAVSKSLVPCVAGV